MPEMTSDFKVGDKVILATDHGPRTGEITSVNTEHDYITVRFALGESIFSRRWAGLNLQRADTPVQRETEDAGV